MKSNSLPRKRVTPYRVNYAVWRYLPVGKSKQKKRTESKCGNLLAYGPFESDKTQHSLRRRIRAANPGWNIEGYCLASLKSRGSSWREGGSPNPSNSFRFAATETGRHTTREGYAMGSEKFNMIHEAVVREMHRANAELLKVPGIKFVPPDTFICESDLSLAEAFAVLGKEFKRLG